jgi:iron complex outermembrane recepter protein
MKRILLLFLLILSVKISAQNSTLKGTVIDAVTKEPIAGANITIKGKLTGTITDSKGNFTLNTSIKPPLELIISSLGFQKQEIQVTSADNPVSVGMSQKNELMDEVVVTASRVEENILKSPVSIEKFDLKSIRQSPSLNFYDGLQNLKSLEMVTSGITYKQVNTRGFNDTGNARFLQLVDGVDNQTPGLSFAVGNLFGSSDLDMESAELIPVIWLTYNLCSILYIDRL